jgi:hypothetical protein
VDRLTKAIKKDRDIESGTNKKNDHTNNKTDNCETNLIEIRKECPILGCTENGKMLCLECNVLAFYCNTSKLSHEIHSSHKYQHKKNWYDNLPLLNDHADSDEIQPLNIQTSTAESIELPQPISQKRKKNNEDLLEPKPLLNRRRQLNLVADISEFSALKTVFVTDYGKLYNSFEENINETEISIKKAANDLTSLVSNKKLFSYKSNIQAYVYNEDKTIVMPDSIEWRKSYIRWILSNKNN